MNIDPFPYAAYPVAAELEAAFESVRSAEPSVQCADMNRLSSTVARASRWIRLEADAARDVEAELAEATAMVNVLAAGLRATSALH